MKTLKALLCLSLFVGTASQAAVEATAAVAPPAATSTSILPSVGAPKFGPLTLKAGFKSQSTAGRSYELATEGGRNYKLKNEIYAGLTHTSGWGASVLGVQSGTATGDTDREQKFVKGDPSLTIIHPTLYDNGDLKLTGQFRRYFAETDRSRQKGLEQYAYYLYSNYKMAGGVAVFNQFTPRYFSQNFYKATDTKQYIEDFTTITKTVNTWFKYGVGQHSQVEWHERTHTGAVIEVYPMMTFVLSSNFFIEPRVNLPVYKDNEVYDSPRAAAWDGAQAEIYMQVSL